jgi:hypothetical protein
MDRREQQRWGQIGGLRNVSRHGARAVTEPARRGLRAKFLREVDPTGELAPLERERRADAALRAHMLRMSLLATKARAKKRKASGDDS